MLLKCYMRDVLSRLSFLIRATGFTTTDLKPSNLIVSPAGHLQLIDFGLGKCNLKWNNLSEIYISPTDSMIGTMYYLPPKFTKYTNSFPCQKFLATR